MFLNKAKFSAAFLTALVIAAFKQKAMAIETASATISSTPIAGGFQYNIALTNTSTHHSPIGTLWFSWIPGVDYMQSMPTSIVTPDRWSLNITGSNNSADGNAIQWLAGTGPLLMPGDTDQFSFDSTESLSQLEAHSTFGDHELETTAFIYSGTTFSDAGTKIVVPEPASFGLIALCGGSLLLRRRRSRVGHSSQK